MSNRLPPLCATDRQIGLITHRSNQVSLSYRLRIRYQIIHYGLSGLSAYQTAKKLGIRADSTARWRSRWLSFWEELCAYERGEEGKVVSDHELVKRMDEILSDEPRSGAPIRIIPAQKQQIVALACKSPSDYGFPVTQWNRELLAEVAMSEGIVDKISPRHVGNILKKQGHPSA